jgi:hypothetical protein
MNRFLIITAFVTIAGASQLQAAEYMPLATGNNWTYQNTAIGASFTVSVGAKQDVNGQSYYTLTGYTNSQLLVRNDQFGNLFYWDANRGMDLLLTSFEIAPGDYFVARDRPCSDSAGQVAEKPVTHDGPAGSWQALQINYQNFCADLGVTAEQYVDHIGMVRRIFTTIAGPRTFDLVAARVGNQIIQVGKFGAFSVTVLPAPPAGIWQATMRLEENSPSGTKLRFPSSQEYDLRLRDSDGKVVWTWSANKLFAQSAHERTVNGSWSAIEAVPQPAASGTAQTFTLETWLTVASGEPQWTATATLDIPAQGVSLNRSAEFHDSPSSRK